MSSVPFWNSDSSKWLIGFAFYQWQALMPESTAHVTWARLSTVTADVAGTAYYLKFGSYSPFMFVLIFYLNRPCLSSNRILWSSGRLGKAWPFYCPQSQKRKPWVTEACILLWWSAEFEAMLSLLCWFPLCHLEHVLSVWMQMRRRQEHWRCVHPTSVWRISCWYDFLSMLLFCCFQDIVAYLSRDLWIPLYASQILKFSKSWPSLVHILSLAHKTFYKLAMLIFPDLQNHNQRVVC